MKRFNISVNGVGYDVCVDEVATDGTTAVTVPSASAPVVAAAPMPAAPVVVPTSTDGEKIPTPMPGTIVDIKVSIGDSVEVNQVVVILEAMKMENEIVSTCSGKVNAICVAKGDSVNTNDVLVIIG